MKIPSIYYIKKDSQTQK